MPVALKIFCRITHVEIQEREQWNRCDTIVESPTIAGELEKSLRNRFNHFLLVNKSHP